MEPRRFQANPKAYCFGMLCMVSAFVFFTYAFYLLPYLLWDWHYDIPDFVLRWMHDWARDEGWRRGTLGWMVFFIFFIPGLLSTLGAKYFSAQTERQFLLPEEAKVPRAPMRPQTKKMMWLVLSLIFFTWIAVHVLVWVIAH